VSAIKATDVSKPAEQGNFIDPKFRQQWQICASSALRPVTTKHYDRLAFDDLLALQCVAEENMFRSELVNVVQARMSVEIGDLAITDQKTVLNYARSSFAEMVATMRGIGSFMIHSSLREELLSANATIKGAWLGCLDKVMIVEISRHEDMLEVEHIAKSHCAAEETAFVAWNKSKLLTDGVSALEVEEIIGDFVVEAPTVSLNRELDRPKS
jgi:hypothetical protein